MLTPKIVIMYFLKRTNKSCILMIGDIFIWVYIDVQFKDVPRQNKINLVNYKLNELIFINVPP